MNWKQAVTATIPQSDGRTAIYVAAKHGHIDTVYELLKTNVDMNIQTSRGNTPLIAALRHEWFDIVHVLLDAGANANIGYLCNRPIAMAVSKQRFDIVNKILHAPNFSVSISENKTLLTTAFEFDDKTIFHLLCDYEGERCGKCQRVVNFNRLLKAHVCAKVVTCVNPSTVKKRNTIQVFGDAENKHRCWECSTMRRDSV